MNDAGQVINIVKFFARREFSLRGQETMDMGHCAFCGVLDGCEIQIWGQLSEEQNAPTLANPQECLLGDDVNCPLIFSIRCIQRKMREVISPNEDGQISQSQLHIIVMQLRKKFKKKGKALNFLLEMISYTVSLCVTVHLVVIGCGFWKKGQSIFTNLNCSNCISWRILSADFLSQ